MRDNLLFKRLEYNLNNRLVLKRIPLVLAVVVLIFMAFLARISVTFTASYEKRPILTMMVTNSILSGIADCVAQSVTIVRERSLRSNDHSNSGVELSDLEKELPIPYGKRDLVKDSITSPFDGERLLRFCVYGFAMGGIQYKCENLSTVN